MKRVALGVLGSVVLLGGGFSLAQRVNPLAMASWLLGLERGRAGLEAARVAIPSGEVAYLHGGDGNAETILLLHGVGASKDHFTRVARLLTLKYRVIAIDLPGFGDSGRDATLPYDIPSQAERVKQVATALGLKRFHLGGSSMGGFISMRYAQAHPEDVRSLWLVDPGGVSGCKESPMLAAYRTTGRSPLFAQRAEDFDAVADWVFEKHPMLPWAIKHVAAERMVADEALHQQIFKELVGSESINASAGSIGAPALIIWGDHDRVLDVSCGEVLLKLLPHAKLEVMPGLGHLPILEAPSGSAEGYLAFLAGLPR